MHLLKIHNKSFANLANALKSKLKVSEISEIPPLNELIQTLSANINHIEKGLTFLDYGLVISNIGTIDILACNSVAGLTMINIYNDKEISEECLVDSIKFIKWIKDHSHLLKKYYPSIKNFTTDPQVYLFATSFTRNALNVLDYIYKTKIELIEFFFIEKSKDEKYLILNPVKSNSPDSYLKDNKIAPKQAFDIDQNIKESLLKPSTKKSFPKTHLSGKEIDEFFKK